MRNIKKILRILTLAALMVLLINRPLYAFHLEKNELSLGLEATSLTSEDDERDGFTAAFPYILLVYEAEVYDTIAFTMDSRADFTVEKNSVDEKAANTFNIETGPALEWSPWEELTLRELMAVSYSNGKPAEKDAPREKTTDLTSRTEVEYSTMIDELHGISSWNEFQRGFTVTAGYYHQLYMEEAGETADDHDRAIGIEAEYSYLNDDIYFMVTPSLSLVKHLNSAVDESLEIEAGLDIFRDANEWLTLGIYVDLNSIKEDPNADFESEAKLGGRAIITKWKDLKLFTRLGFIRSISDNSADPAYTFTLGAEYDLYY